MNPAAPVMSQWGRFWDDGVGREFDISRRFSHESPYTGSMAVPNSSILVIEDVQAMRFHLKQMLQELGFTRIQTASSV